MTAVEQWQSMQHRERDAWIAEHVMRWDRDPDDKHPGSNVSWFIPDREHRGEGTGTTVIATTAPPFSSHAEFDYHVLKRVREAWGGKRLWNFAVHFHTITGLRARTAEQQAVFSVMYEPGDWSRAAFLAMND